MVGWGGEGTCQPQSSQISKPGMTHSPAPKASIRGAPLPSGIARVQGPSPGLWAGPTAQEIYPGNAQSSVPSGCHSVLLERGADSSGQVGCAEVDLSGSRGSGTKQASPELLGHRSLCPLSAAISCAVGGVAQAAKHLSAGRRGQESQRRPPPPAGWVCALRWPRHPQATLLTA